MSKSSQLRQKAQDYLKKGKVSEAIEAYKKLLQVEPRNPNLYNELGDIYMKAEDKLQAVSSLEKAVENYEKVALYNNAVAVCKKILRVVPNRLESIYKLGELKAKQKFNGEASRLFTQYFDMIAADENGVRPEAVLPKVELVMELVPEDDELHARVAEVLTGVGLKISAAEIFANLIVKSAKSDDSGKIDFYRGRLDLLRGALSANEQARIEEILAGCLELADEEIADGEPDLNVEEIDTTAAAEAAGSDPEEEPAPEAQKIPAAEEAPAKEHVIEVAPAASVIPLQHESPGPVVPGTAPEAEYEIPVEPEPVKEYEIPAEPEPVKEFEIPAMPAAEEAEIGPDTGVTPSNDDLSDILEAEDSANEAAGDLAFEEGAIDTGRLAEEITSDVEENDFRSHYDLGMAYIEMALYNEAIKELQISSRSDQLQLRSLEMIGHCFLLLDNPRLAVKQLKRGLEIAMNTGGDNLGIHYNLGLAYEALDESDKAREHFEEVYIVDMTFREISEKMKKYSTVS
jgi:tetratricopeptide (TPR) repeat protein